MNYAYIHLVTNHFPIVGASFGIFILLIGFFKKSDEFKKAALWIFLLSGLFAIPAWYSGGNAAHIVKDLTGVTKDAIGPHAEMADKFAIAIGAVGFLSLIGPRGSVDPQGTHDLDFCRCLGCWWFVRLDGQSWGANSPRRNPQRFPTRS
jgi:hypothetical protein